MQRGMRILSGTILGISPVYGLGILVDLYNRKIIGYSAGEHKTAEPVKEAFQAVEALVISACSIQTVETNSKARQSKNLWRHLT